MSLCRTSTPAYHGQLAEHLPEAHEWLLSLLLMTFSGQPMPSPMQYAQPRNLCELIGELFRSETPRYLSIRTQD